MIYYNKGNQTKQRNEINSSKIQINNNNDGSYNTNRKNNKKGYNNNFMIETDSWDTVKRFQCPVLRKSCSGTYIYI